MILKYIQNGESLNLEAEKCTGCRMCLTVCPHQVFDFSPLDKKASISDSERCMECGACALNCPSRAIRVDRGVGCAQAVIFGLFRGTPPDCSCSNGSSGCC